MGCKEGKINFLVDNQMVRSAKHSAATPLNRV